MSSTTGRDLPGLPQEAFPPAGKGAGQVPPPCCRGPLVCGLLREGGHHQRRETEQKLSPPRSVIRERERERERERRARAPAVEASRLERVVRQSPRTHAHTVRMGLEDFWQPFLRADQ